MTTARAEDFWAQVARGAPELCWPWQGPTDAHGYGLLARGAYVHRVAYQVFHGRLPPGATVSPCPVLRTCCNPAHLRRGYQRLPRGRGPTQPR